ncbi:MAG: LamG-like jellyroll fold domain-containing protein [Gammaproteobacteria bacterium]
MLIISVIAFHVSALWPVMTMADYLADKAPNDSVGNNMVVTGNAVQTTAVKHLGAASLRIPVPAADIDYVSTTDDAEVEHDEIMICGWTRVDDRGQTNQVTQKNFAWQVQLLTNSKMQTRFWDTNSTATPYAVSSNTHTSTTTFFHFCSYYLNNTVRLRLNGGSVALASHIGTMGLGTWAAEIPRRSTFFTSGYFDEHKIFDLAGYSNTQADDLALKDYNSGTGYSCADTTTATYSTQLLANDDLTACWDFETPSDGVAPVWQGVGTDPDIVVSPGINDGEIDVQWSEAIDTESAPEKYQVCYDSDAAAETGFPDYASCTGFLSETTVGCNTDAVCDYVLSGLVAGITYRVTVQAADNVDNATSYIDLVGEGWQESIATRSGPIKGAIIVVD